MYNLGQFFLNSRKIFHPALFLYVELFIPDKFPVALFAACKLLGTRRGNHLGERCSVIKGHFKNKLPASENHLPPAQNVNETPAW